MKKICKDCGQEKDILAFEKCSKTGYRNTCRRCRQLGKGEHISFTCPICGQVFERAASYLQEIQERGYKETYCSRACQRSNAKKVKKSDYQDILTAYEQGESAVEIALRYDATPTIILRVFAHYDIKPRQSSDYIKMGKYPHPTAGKGHTQQAIEKIRKATMRQFSTQEARAQAASKQSKAISDGKFAVVSQVEKTVEVVLQTLNIPYFPQSLIRDPQTKRFCGCVDFELPNNIVIEVNGTYWHSDPRFYPNGPIHKSQIQAAKAYAKKMEALKRLGYRVVEIWEYDINLDATAAVINALNGASCSLPPP